MLGVLSLSRSSLLRRSAQEEGEVNWDWEDARGKAFPARFHYSLSSASELTAYTYGQGSTKEEWVGVFLFSQGIFFFSFSKCHLRFDNQLSVIFTCPPIHHNILAFFRYSQLSPRGDPANTDTLLLQTQGQFSGNY